MSAAAAPHPLDNPVWTALTTRQRSLAIGGDLARRYRRDLTPLVAVRLPDARAFAELATIVRPGEHVYLGTHAQNIPETWSIVREAQLTQMTGPTRLDAAAIDAPVVELGANDADQMVELTSLTQPGPFLAGTHRLGTYLGIFSGPKLVAMAGERMRLDGFCEISAVCTHPDFLGRGYARHLIARLASAIGARGETPFLHVIATNERAITLYVRLGFVVRRTTRVAVIALRD